MVTRSLLHINNAMPNYAASKRASGWPEMSGLVNRAGSVLFSPHITDDLVAKLQSPGQCRAFDARGGPAGGGAINLDCGVENPHPSGGLDGAGAGPAGGRGNVSSAGKTGGTDDCIRRGIRFVSEWLDYSEPEFLVPAYSGARLLQRLGGAAWPRWHRTRESR